MKELLKKYRRWRTGAFGQAVEAVVYAVMLLLLLMFFTGNGQFIYEGF